MRLLVVANVALSAHFMPQTTRKMVGGLHLLNAREIVDHIPFAELVRENGDQEIDRIFAKKYELDPTLIVRRTSLFAHGCRNGTWRRRIWEECLLDGISVGEVRERIATGDYNKPSFEGDIVIAAFRGAILLQKP